MVSGTPFTFAVLARVVVYNGPSPVPSCNIPRVRQGRPSHLGGQAKASFLENIFVAL